VGVKILQDLGSGRGDCHCCKYAGRISRYGAPEDWSGLPYLTNPIHEMANTISHLCTSDQFRGFSGSFSSKSTRIILRSLSLAKVSDGCAVGFPLTLSTSIVAMGSALDIV
jgi:hypothetical protein